MSNQSAELCLCSSTLWKVEPASDETGYLAEDVFKQYVERQVKVVQSCTNSLQPHGLHSRWNSPGQNTGVGSLSLIQGIFATQRSNSGLPHCRQILYVSHIAGRFFTSSTGTELLHSRPPDLTFFISSCACSPVPLSHPLIIW